MRPDHRFHRWLFILNRYRGFISFQPAETARSHEFSYAKLFSCAESNRTPFRGQGAIQAGSKTVRGKTGQGANQAGCNPGRK